MTSLISYINTLKPELNGPKLFFVIWLNSHLNLLPRIPFWKSQHRHLSHWRYFNPICKFDQNLLCSSLKYAQPITMKFCADMCRILLWSTEYILNQSMANVGGIFQFDRNIVSGTGAWFKNDLASNRCIAMTYINNGPIHWYLTERNSINSLIDWVLFMSFCEKNKQKNKQKKQTPTLIRKPSRSLTTNQAK